MDNLKDILLSPVIAFGIYMVLVTILSGIGKSLSADVTHESAEKSSIFASGEAPSRRQAAPGYRQFFVVALFFAILHLGALVLGTGNLEPIMLLYMMGLFSTLIIMTLG